MIELPDFNKAFEYENNFYLSCDNSRISRFITHYELYKMIQSIHGEIIECGVFKGSSFSRFAMFLEIFGNPLSKKLIGFDAFGKFPETKFAGDKAGRKEVIDFDGNEGISKQQMIEVFKHKGINTCVELVEGDVTETIPAYVESHPDLKISLLNLDTDTYEPAVTILEYLYPRIVDGGILILDDYKVFPGETKAVDEYFKEQKSKIKKFPFREKPYFIIK
jgi:hypothetical protein